MGGTLRGFVAAAHCVPCAHPSRRMGAQPALPSLPAPRPGGVHPALQGPAADWLWAAGRGSRQVPGYYRGESSSWRARCVPCRPCTAAFQAPRSCHACSLRQPALHPQAHIARRNTGMPLQLGASTHLCVPVVVQVLMIDPDTEEPIKFEAI